MIRDWSLFNLKILFFLFPGCGWGVTVPISIKPNPKLDSSLKSSAFLSNPAASPTGFGNFIPKTSLSSNFEVIEIENKNENKDSFFIEKVIMSLSN